MPRVKRKASHKNIELQGLAWWFNGWASACHCKGNGFNIPGLEDPTCSEATGPTCHNDWACALEPTCHSYWGPRTPEPVHHNEKPLQWEAHAPQENRPHLLQLEEAHTQQQRPSTAIKKLINLKKKKKHWTPKLSFKRTDFSGNRMWSKWWSKALSKTIEQSADN